MTGSILSERQPTSMAVLYDGREAVHFTAHEGNLLVVLSVPSSNAKYPTSQVLRRQHALNFAQKVDDAIVHFSDAGEPNSDGWGVHAAGVDFAIQIHETAVVEISFAHADEQAIASAFLPLRQAVRLVYWLRSQFARSACELGIRTGRHRALCRAIDWPEGAAA